MTSVGAQGRRQHLTWDDGWSDIHLVAAQVYDLGDMGASELARLNAIMWDEIVPVPCSRRAGGFGGVKAGDQTVPRRASERTARRRDKPLISGTG
jgi:hypothetical protein